MRNVGCKLSGNLFQPLRRNKRFPAAAPVPQIAWEKYALLRRRPGDREQEVVELSSESFVGQRPNAITFRDKSQTLLVSKSKICGHAFDRMSITRATENINSNVKI